MQKKMGSVLRQQASEVNKNDREWLKIKKLTVLSGAYLELLVLKH
ncbi:hypothetical protein [Acinetobacter ihumii]|nr:hypothetical protein [Acinetobacter ihumii]